MPYPETLCRVFWYSHGCDRPRGHRDLHLCTSGHEPYSPFYRGLLAYRVFGEDTKLWERTLTRLTDPYQRASMRLWRRRNRRRNRRDASSQPGR